MKVFRFMTLFMFLFGVFYSGGLLAMQRGPRVQRAGDPGRWPTSPLKGFEKLDADKILDAVQQMVLVAAVYPNEVLTRFMDEKLFLFDCPGDKVRLHELLKSFWEASGILASTSRNDRAALEDYARRFLAGQQTKTPKAVITLVEEDETDSICCFYGSCCVGACLCSVGCVGCCLGWF